jgi:hypothetical protein
LFGDQDFLSGLMFAGVGAVGRYLSYDFPLGTLMAPGSGAFPMLLCYGLILIGLCLIVRSFFVAGVRSTGWNPWALTFVVLAIVSFQFLIDSAGLVIAMVSLIVLAAIAGRETRPGELIVFSIILIALSVGLFVIGLGLPIRALPWI